MLGKQEGYCMTGMNGGVCKGECLGHNPGDEPLWVVTAI